MSEIPTLPGFEPALTCGNGGVWGPTGCGPCDGCQAESARLQAQYEQRERDTDQQPTAKARGLKAQRRAA